MQKRTRTGVALAAAVVVWAGLPGARPSMQQPTFRASRDLVQIDVSVLDKTRRPITGLTAEDFVVLEDGKPRPVVAFSAVALPASPPATAAWVRNVPSDAATNRVPDDGRMVIVVFDRSIPPGLATITARKIATASIEQLGPGDLGAVVSIGKGAPQNFTNDRQRLLAAVNHPDPGTVSSQDQQDIDAAFNAIFADMTGGPAPVLQDGSCYCGLCELETIQGIADSVRDVPRRRKSLIYIGADITVQASDPECGFRVRDARTKMLRAVDAANLTIHAFDPVGLDVIAPQSRASTSMRPPNGSRGGGFLAAANQEATTTQLSRQGSLSVFPEHTGGRTILNTNDAPATISEIFRESETFYLLGFEPADGKDDGRFHKVEVKVRQKGVTVHSRDGYYASDAGGDAQRRILASPAAQSMAGALPDAELPLGLTVSPFATADGKNTALLLALDVRPSAPPSARTPVKDELKIVAAAFDRLGRPAGAVRQTSTIDWPVDVAPGASLAVLTRLDVPSGSYEVRLAVENTTTGRTGSVYTFVDAPKFGDAALSLSGLVLALGTGATTRPNGPVGELLPLSPTVHRDFLQTDRVSALARVYVGSRVSERPVVPVLVTTRLVDATDRDVFNQTMTLDATRSAAGQSTDIRFPVPISALPPGEYLLSVGASRGKDVVTRTVRLQVHDVP